MIPPPGYQVKGEFQAILFGKLEPIGFLMSSTQDHILAFRGTDSFLDWLADATYVQTSFDLASNGGRVHAGFKLVYQSAREQILTALLAAQTSLPLYITGHSLGGGLATVAALDIAFNTTFANPIVYSFASPRVGDPDFAARSNAVIQTHWRVLNTLDVVPLVPPEKIFDGTKELHFQHVDEWQPITFLKGFVAENHSLTNYIQKLSTL